jgi:hypothetical protein
VEGSQARWVALTLEVPAESVQGVSPGSHPVTVLVEARDERDGRTLGLVKEKTAFVVPR